MGQLAAANYFSTLGVNPGGGGSFLPEEDNPGGASHVAVISYRFWHQQYASDTGILSRDVNLNGRPFRIVGVAPEGFQGLDTLTATDIWVPIELFRDLYPAPALMNQRRFLVLN